MYVSLFVSITGFFSLVCFWGWFVVLYVRCVVPPPRFVYGLLLCWCYVWFIMLWTCFLLSCCFVCLFFKVFCCWWCVYCIFILLCSFCLFVAWSLSLPFVVFCYPMLFCSFVIFVPFLFWRLWFVMNVRCVVSSLYCCCCVRLLGLFVCFIVCYMFMFGVLLLLCFWCDVLRVLFYMFVCFSSCFWLCLLCYMLHSRCQFLSMLLPSKSIILLCTFVVFSNV